MSAGCGDPAPVLVYMLSRRLYCPKAAQGVPKGPKARPRVPKGTPKRATGSPREPKGTPQRATGNLGNRRKSRKINESDTYWHLYENLINTGTSDKYGHLRNQRNSMNVYESDKYGRLSETLINTGTSEIDENHLKS